MVPTLLEKINGFFQDQNSPSNNVEDKNNNCCHDKEKNISTRNNHDENTVDVKMPPYNACLQNWYEPDDTVGLHSDDESYMRKDFPIFSLSWGGPRRFLFRSKKSSADKTELWLEDGDLLVMGGDCQLTHKHEVPKHRIKMDSATSKRINWTIRAVKFPGSVGV